MTNIVTNQTTLDLIQHFKDWKEIILTCNDKGTKWNVFYVKNNQLNKIYHWHFIIDDNFDYRNVYDCNTTADLKKVFKKNNFNLPWYYFFNRNSDYNFACSAIWTSRPLEIVLSIGYSLWLQFNEIKQNYRVL